MKRYFKIISYKKLDDRRSEMKTKLSPEFRAFHAKEHNLETGKGINNGTGKTVMYKEFEERYTYDSVTDKIGEGGFGSLFKAYDKHRNRYVTLKIAKVSDENMRLKKEFETVTKLTVHTNIAYYEQDCYTFKLFDGIYDFGILQYYEQGNLLDLLKRGNLSFAQKHSILMQILSGIEFLHNHGIIHSDLKPHNILIMKHGNEYIPKITNFGISKRLDINGRLQVGNSIPIVSTFAYASPEQLSANIIDKNSDLWSFGVVAYQMFTKTLPFTTGRYAETSEEGRVELFRQIKEGQLPDAINGIAKSWQRLIRACLVPDPRKRVADSKACLEVFNWKSKPNFELETEPDPKLIIDPVIDPAPVPTPVHAFKKRTFLIIITYIAGLLLIIIAGILPYLYDDVHQMVFVQGGKFTMGCTSEQDKDCDQDERPEHLVELSSYYIGKYEVTQAQWNTIMKTNPSSFKGANLPVESVSWNDVEKFIQKLNEKTGKKYRLPTEAEWEYAARGGNKSQGYKYSGSNDANEVAWYGSNSDGKTHPVGQKTANELGLHDMNGNVSEWCNDKYKPYDKNEKTQTKYENCWIYRGGGWNESETRVRVSRRCYIDYRRRNNVLGFRLARSE
jgi:serine/threonine protein kinase